MTRILPSFLFCFKHGLQLPPSRAGSIADAGIYPVPAKHKLQEYVYGSYITNTTALGRTLPKMSQSSS